jgi:hypothetical protein
MIKDIKIYILIIFLVLYIGINIDKTIQKLLFFNYTLKHKKYSIKTLDKPTLIVATHRVGMEYIERVIANLEIKSSKIPVHLIVNNNYFNILYNMLTFNNSKKSIYVKENTVNKAIKSLKSNNHILTFYYKNQTKASSGLYYIAKKTNCPILLMDIKFSNNFGLNKMYTVEYKKFDYDKNLEKDMFLEQLTEKMF